MSDSNGAQTGMLGSLRRLCDNGVTLLHNRVELLSVELQEQKARLVKLLVLAAVASLVGFVAFLLLNAVILVAVGDEARFPVLIGLCVLYALVAAAAIFALRKELRAPLPFSGTLDQLKKDQEWLRGRR
jgi:uncharacterized membrane protein YqjE